MDPFNKYFVVFVLFFVRVELFDIFFFHTSIEQSTHYHAES